MAPKRKSTSKQHASKRQKVTTKDPNQALIADTLFGCADIVAIIVSFLHVRELLPFVCASKQLRSLLTYEQVIRATLLHGGYYPQLSLSRIVSSVRLNTIWIPSPLRLLRVVLGKRCERCNVKVSNVRETFCVFFCENCTIQPTQLFQSQMPYINAPRVEYWCRKGYYGSYLISSPLKDRCGNRIGPLVTAADMRGIQTGGKSSPSKNVAAFTQSCDILQPHADSARETILESYKRNRQYIEDKKAALERAREEAAKRKSDALQSEADEGIQKLKDILSHDQGLLTKLESREWDSRYCQYQFSDIILDGVLLTWSSDRFVWSSANLKEAANEIQRMTNKRRLADRHIQQIMDYVDHEDAGHVVRSDWHFAGGCYHFGCICVNGVLKNPLSDPRSLSENDIDQLAIRVKRIVHRKRSAENILEVLERNLDGLPVADDIKRRQWHHFCWYFSFSKSYVDRILQEPLLSPWEISDEKLNDLEKQLRAAMEKQE
mmetsp:Transcript_40037/g.96605  ORF Transcript_40037/g.96605 Transcript_40037/m.96605 type:complete len:490 (+) Transcript_40037:1330-2799(+)